MQGEGVMCCIKVVVKMLSLPNAPPSMSVNASLPRRVREIERDKSLERKM